MAAVTVLLLAVSPRYGPHWDELYFAMLRPQWGYVDQPPLTVWLTWLASVGGDALWVQRLPAIAAAAAGAYVAGHFPRALGAGPGVQRLAAWAHAFTVYPLIVGHIFTTASIDLLVWLLVILLVLRACLGQANSLIWAGLVAGVGCWNKLLVVSLVGALVLSLALTERRVLRTRAAAAGALVFVVLAGPQVLLQAVQGWPMTEVSAGLVDQQGNAVRLGLLPALALFAGPPLVFAWLGGLLAPWREPGRPGRFLLPTVLLLVAFTMAAPAQPYYPMGVVLSALAMGWTSLLAGRWSPRQWRRAVLANGAVSVLVCLPILPAQEPWITALARVNPTVRDSLGWPDYAAQIAAERREGEAIIVGDYALAGAVHRFAAFPARAGVFSGHNGLWDLGPPTSDHVLLVGTDAVAHRSAFRHCDPAPALRSAAVVHPRLEHVPMEHCSGPTSDWATLWPRFRRISG